MGYKYHGLKKVSHVILQAFTLLKREKGGDYVRASRRVVKGPYWHQYIALSGFILFGKLLLKSTSELKLIDSLLEKFINIFVNSTTIQ